MVLDMHIIPPSFVFFVVICLVNSEDRCEVKRVENGDVLKKDLFPIRNSSGHQTDANVSYFQAETSSFEFSGSSLYVRCRDPYRFQGDRSRELAEIICIDDRWLPFPVCLIPPCDKRSLHYPGLDKGGENIFFNGESFEPKCQHGYSVAEKADKRIHCQNGLWTGNLPPCIDDETECKMPEKPDFGSVELVGNNLKLGSIVVYKCDPGRKLVGSSSSKCIKSGEWTFPTPECVEPCVIPAVANGELGRYEEQFRLYRRRTVFKKLAVGTIVDENEEVILRCNENYMSRTEHRQEITITCQRKLTPVPECVTTSCLGNPPSIQNGRAVVRARDNGSVIWYMCNREFKIKITGIVRCVDGSWVGSPPVCENTRCHKSTLNYPGLGRTEGVVSNGRSFMPVCLSGYEVIEKVDKRIHCSKGIWTGNLPPCTAAQCRTEELAGFSGLVLGDSPSLDEGDSFQPTCAEGFEFSNKVDSKIYCRGGVWEGNLPPCSPSPGRCYLRNLNAKEGVDLTSDSPVDSNSRANIVCITGYNLKYPEVYCEHGEWKTENLLSPCQENDCEVKQILNGKILKERSIPIKNRLEIITETVREPANIGTFASSGAVMYVECDSQYRFQGDGSKRQVRITCNKGLWMPLTLPECVRRTNGCAGLQKKSGSELLITPEKEFYNWGDSIIVSCPTGKSLTPDVERILCFKNVWIPDDIPDCQ